MTTFSGWFSVRTDFYQYYALGLGGTFDASSVDMANDGVLAPGLDGVRVDTGTHGGEVDVSVETVEGLIPYPNDVVAAACNLLLPLGIITINHFAGPSAYTHEFGHPLTCALLVTVVDRDEANHHNHQPGAVPRERHTFQLSATPFPQARWRSRAIDTVGRHFAIDTSHVE